MFRARRDHRGDDRFFEIKAVLLVFGASMGIAGMMYEIGWLVWAAIGVVVVAMILRLIADRQRRNQMDE